ncbi:hypothetical protein ALC62_09649 [Cyphomyrmex costatus]|uniref:Uncharacterized protein n=1 Tax=Cyphomyrmex costatus TaxID=456900 RepID=A0A151IFB6_9HYME|nr:hypothetical protein ALC62_09649 [Cyphomyrmex costatus]
MRSGQLGKPGHGMGREIYKFSYRRLHPWDFRLMGCAGYRYEVSRSSSFPERNRRNQVFDPINPTGSDWPRLILLCTTVRALFFLPSASTADRGCILLLASPGSNFKLFDILSYFPDEALLFGILLVGGNEKDGWRRGRGRLAGPTATARAARIPGILVFSAERAAAHPTAAKNYAALVCLVCASADNLNGLEKRPRRNSSWVSSSDIYGQHIHAVALSEHMLPVSASFGVVFIHPFIREAAWRGAFRRRISPTSSFASFDRSTATEVETSNCESSRLVNVIVITHVHPTISTLAVALRRAFRTKLANSRLHDLPAISTLPSLRHATNNETLTRYYRELVIRNNSL